MDVQLQNGQPGWLTHRLNGHWDSCFKDNYNRIGKIERNLLTPKTVSESVNQKVMGNRWDFNQFTRAAL